MPIHVGDKPYILMKQKGITLSNVIINHVIPKVGTHVQILVSACRSIFPTGTEEYGQMIAAVGIPSALTRGYSSRIIEKALTSKDLLYRSSKMGHLEHKMRSIYAGVKFTAIPSGLSWQDINGNFVLHLDDSSGLLENAHQKVEFRAIDEIPIDEIQKFKEAAFRFSESQLVIKGVTRETRTKKSSLRKLSIEIEPNIDPSFCVFYEKPRDG